MTPKPIHILLVEDNPGDVLLTRRALERAKITNTLSVVHDGEAALQYLRNEGEFGDALIPDLVLLDLNLPRLDGREVLQQVKADPVLRRIPVVVLTTSNAEEDIARSYDLNANCFVTKPVDLKQFMKVVRTIESFWIEIVQLPPKPNGG